MLVKQIKKLLPKRVCEGVALNRILSQHQLSSLRGVFGKLTRFTGFSKAAKLALGASLMLFLSGYQPVWAIPPLRQATAQAASIQEQFIDASHLSVPFQLPHAGYLTTHFSSWHPGIDIATGLGMPIHPISAGKVAEVTFGYFGLGHDVVVEHEFGFRSTYGHMGRIFARVGDTVSPSSILGEVGLTGHTSGPHTHLEITKDGKYLDPEKILPALSDWPVFAGKGPAGQGSVKPTKEKPASTPVAKLNLLDMQKLENPTDDAKEKLLKSLNYLPL